MPRGGVKEFKGLVLVYEATGPATVKFSTDMPGGQMAQRALFTSSDACKIEDTNGERRTVRFPLDGIVGQLFELEVTPGASTQLKLFEGYLELKYIGEFRDGECGEIFKTDELTAA